MRSPALLALLFLFLVVSSYLIKPARADFGVVGGAFLGTSKTLAWAGIGTAGKSTIVTFGVGVTGTVSLPVLAGVGCFAVALGTGYYIWYRVGNEFFFFFFFDNETRIEVCYHQLSSGTKVEDAARNFSPQEVEFLKKLVEQDEKIKALGEKLHSTQKENEELKAQLRLEREEHKKEMEMLLTSHKTELGKHQAALDKSLQLLQACTEEWKPAHGLKQ